MEAMAERGRSVKKNVGILLQDTGALAWEGVVVEVGICFMYC